MSGTSPRAQLGGSQRAAQGDFPGRAAKPLVSWQGGRGCRRGRGPEGTLGPLLGNEMQGMGCVGRSQASTGPHSSQTSSFRESPQGVQHHLLPLSLSQGPNLENLLPCSGETKAPCSQASPQSSGGPNPFWPSLPTIGSAPMISNGVCDVGLSHLPLVHGCLSAGGKETKAQGPRVSLTELSPCRKSLPVRGWH